MLFFFSVRVEHGDVSFEELWDEWEKEVDAAQGAVSAGKIRALYKVSGQRRVIGILDAESHDELDRIFMAALPMAHRLDFEEIVPVREYGDFADDVRKRWQE
ncbi:MAG: translational initiation factor [Pseudonocardiaceae bacterium]|nr:translational initiation factor [Pseudonocardiaceae bacterium]